MEKYEGYLWDEMCNCGEKAERANVSSDFDQKTKSSYVIFFTR